MTSHKKFAVYWMWQNCPSRNARKKNKERIITGPSDLPSANRNLGQVRSRKFERSSMLIRDEFFVLSISLTKFYLNKAESVFVPLCSRFEKRLRYIQVTCGVETTHYIYHLLTLYLFIHSKF